MIRFYLNVNAHLHSQELRSTGAQNTISVTASSNTSVITGGHPATAVADYSALPREFYSRRNIAPRSLGKIQPPPNPAAFSLGGTGLTAEIKGDPFLNTPDIFQELCKCVCDSLSLSLTIERQLKTRFISVNVVVFAANTEAVVNMYERLLPPASATIPTPFGDGGGGEFVVTSIPPNSTAFLSWQHLASIPLPESPAADASASLSSVLKCKSPTGE